VSPLAYFSLGHNGRDLSIRFRLVWRRGEPRFEPMVLTRPFGLPIGDGVPAKPATDVLLEATAYPAHAGATRAIVSLRCAEVARELVIHGRRRARIRNEQVSFSAVEAVEPTPLVHANAYGGGLGTDRAFPRNPAGKGFITQDQLVDSDIELPLVEEGTLLTPQNLVASWPAWWRQPAPALVEPLLPTNMPRLMHLGLGTPYPQPGPLVARSGPELLQEAPSHSRVATLPEGTPIEVVGCLPDGQPFGTRAPRQPRVTLTIEGQVIDAAVRPQTLRIRPEASELSVTYGIEHALARTFLPGVHARIPIAVEIEGNRVPYPTEEPLLKQLRRAKIQQEPDKS
jgi:hypothetical protein